MLSLPHAILLLTLAAATGAAAAAPATCDAHSGVIVPTIVELYTSEGCSSCPPADRWLSSLKDQPGVVSLAFHVDYWDNLGWKDRFADAAYTQRQHEVGARSGAKFIYTPQIVVDGLDYRRWPALPPAAARPATVQATLVREGDDYVARLVRAPGAPARIAGFWALTEDGHSSQVKAGENHGATLRHDAVVRDYRAIGTVGNAPLRYTPHAIIGSTANQHVHLVLTDADSGKPVQAVGC